MITVEFIVTIVLATYASFVHSLSHSEPLPGASDDMYNTVVLIYGLSSEHGDHLCTGVIIGRAYLLVIADCIHGVDPNTMTIFHPDFNQGELKVEKIYQHKNYQIKEIPGENRNISINNLAIMKLTGGEFVEGMMIVISDRPVQTVNVFGWDPQFEASESEDMKGPLLSSSASLQPFFKCLNITINSNFRCYQLQKGYFNNIDSGSPISSDSGLVGLAYVTATTDTKYVVMIELSNYLLWMRRVILEDERPRPKGRNEYVVSIWTNQVPICGGIIITNSYIVTAAHCVNDIPESKILVVVKEAVLYEDDDLYSAIPIIGKKIFSQYQIKNDVHTPEHYEHDIAILKLSVAQQWGPKLIRPKLAKSPPELGIKCSIYRWSASKRSFRGPIKKLAISNGIVVSNNVCQKNGEHLDQQEFCVQYDGPSTAASAGDHGNPIECKGVVHGFVTRNFPSDVKSTSTIFLDISAYKDFVETAMNEMKNLN